VKVAPQDRTLHYIIPLVPTMHCFSSCAGLCESMPHTYLDSTPSCVGEPLATSADAVRTRCS